MESSLTYHYYEWYIIIFIKTQTLNEYVYRYSHKLVWTHTERALKRNAYNEINLGNSLNVCIYFNDNLDNGRISLKQ